LPPCCASDQLSTSGTVATRQAVSNLEPRNLEVPPPPSARRVSGKELKGTEFPSEVFQSLGYESVAVTQKAYNGVAILSRHPIPTAMRGSWK
jgi:hypothetical protein